MPDQADRFIDSFAQAEQVVLHWTRYAAIRHMSHQAVSHMSFETGVDVMRDTIIARIKADVLRHKVLEDHAEVPVVGHIETTRVPRYVMIEVPNGWVRKLFRRRTRKMWAPVIGNAAHIDTPDTIEVLGSAVVKAEYFQTFPEAMVYPQSLGNPVVMVTRSQPSDWAPEAVMDWEPQVNTGNPIGRWPY